MLSFIITTQILTIFEPLERVPGLLSFLSFFWALLPFYIVKHHWVAWRFSLRIVLHGFLPSFVFCRVEQEIVNRSSQQIISSTQTTRHELIPKRNLKSQNVKFQVTDISSLYYSSASWSLQRPGAQVYDVIYNYVTWRAHIIIWLVEAKILSKIPLSCTGIINFSDILAQMFQGSIFSGRWDALNFRLRDL